MELQLKVSAGRALSGAAENWPAQVRAGLATLLRGRIPPPMRQVAILLSAAVLHLTGPEWLLFPLHAAVRLLYGTCTSDTSASKEG